MNRLNVKRLDFAYCLWESVFLRIQVRANKRSGARFWKDPIINGTVKLLLFTYKIEVSIVLHLT